MLFMKERLVCQGKPLFPLRAVLVVTQELDIVCVQTLQYYISIYSTLCSFYPLSFTSFTFSTISKKKRIAGKHSATAPFQGHQVLCKVVINLWEEWEEKATDWTTMGMKRHLHFYTGSRQSTVLCYFQLSAVKTVLNSVCETSVES